MQKNLKKKNNNRPLKNTIEFQDDKNIKKKFSHKKRHFVAAANAIASGPS